MRQTHPSSRGEKCAIPIKPPPHCARRLRIATKQSKMIFKKNARSLGVAVNHRAAIPKRPSPELRHRYRHSPSQREEMPKTFAYQHSRYKCIPEPKNCPAIGKENALNEDIKYKYRKHVKKATCHRGQEKNVRVIADWRFKRYI